jgi:hypothetical protein
MVDVCIKTPVYLILDPGTGITERVDESVGE